MDTGKPDELKDIRDNAGRRIGTLRVSALGYTTVFDSRGHTIGYSRHDGLSSGPGYTYSFKKGRIAQCSCPELLLNEQEKRKDNP